LNRFTIQRAAKTLREGGIIAYPTESVFGLGCDPLNEEALHRILKIKNRSVNKGLILVASEFSQLQPFLGTVEPALFDRISQSWPGPTTWLLPANFEAPKMLRGKFKLQAVRVSKHSVVHQICEAYGGAIVSTSANLSNRPPTRTTLTTRLRFNKQVDLIVDGKVGELKQPSEIKNAMTGDIIRPA